MTAPPLPMAYWEALRQLAEPFELMKFTLIWDGDLAAGKSSRVASASLIRNAFHDQLADLWNRDVILKTLARTARTHRYHGGFFGGGPIIYSPSRLPDHDETIPPLEEGQTDFCAPIQVPNVGRFIPLVRQSLYLACNLDILFLRHDDNLKVLQQGGDLDNRIKTLIDALKMPKNPDEQSHDLTADPLFVVLEDDALVHSFSVKGGKLLGQSIKKEHAVRLTIDVTIKVLRVFEQNLCLVGD